MPATQDVYVSALTAAKAANTSRYFLTKYATLGLVRYTAERGSAIRYNLDDARKLAAKAHASK